LVLFHAFLLLPEYYDVIWNDSFPFLSSNRIKYSKHISRHNLAHAFSPLFQKKSKILPFFSSSFVHLQKIFQFYQKSENFKFHFFSIKKKSFKFKVFFSANKHLPLYPRTLPTPPFYWHFVCPHTIQNKTKKRKNVKKKILGKFLENWILSENGFWKNSASSTLRLYRSKWKT
jgi:hypothetical protein